MRTARIDPTLDLAGVFAVPPLARRSSPDRALDWSASERLVRHMHAGGITRLLYGGNAFLYHLTMREYEPLLDWLSSLDDALWAIPSAGPSYGRLIDQAALLRRHRFPCVMTLPCADPRDPAGLEAGLREFTDAAGTPLMLYLKEEHNFGSPVEAGLDVVARLVSDGLCIAIKYAVVRDDPAQDAYVAALLERVDRRFVISGIGERPAITHLRDWGLPGFTTGSGCVAPALSQAIFERCAAGQWDQAQILREHFLPLEDLRDLWGPARVLHAAIELAGISRSGPIPPFLSALTAAQQTQLRPVAERLAAAVQGKTAAAEQ